MTYALGIDIGTGSTKAVAVDINGNAYADYQEFYGFSAPKPGYHEQNPEDIWKAFVKCVKGITKKIGGDPTAIGLSSALHSFIPVDEHCKALAPMMTWADSRSFEVAKRLRASKAGMAIYRATGTPLHAMSPLCKLIWLRDNQPDLFASAYKFISIKDYVWYRLFKEFKVDHSIASGMGLFNITSLDWHKEALKKASIAAQRLATPVPTNYTTVYNGDDDFIKSGTPITIGASDGCLANLGSMADQPGIAAITIGTSGAVRVASPKPLPNDAAMIFSYILDNKTFICGGAVNNGGIAVQWWLKNFYGDKLTEKEYSEAFDEIAGVTPGAEGLIFLPYLNGERAPIWDSETCGNFFGVRLQHTKAHFSRAMLEGICFALKDVLDAIEQNSGEVKQINISGGFVKSEVWVQILADITGKSLVVIQSEDASAVGAALIALKANKLIKVYPSLIDDDSKLIKPRSEHKAVYAQNFSIYRDMYSALKNIMHKAESTILTDLPEHNKGVGIT